MIKIYPSNLHGKIVIPPSKSLSHRAIICASLANGISNISNIILSDDILATMQGMESFGAIIREEKSLDKLKRYTFKIQGKSKVAVVNKYIHCHESGSTLRFLIPLAGLVGEEIVFSGSGKLVERPLQSYYSIFDQRKIKYTNANGKLPLAVNGLLIPGTYEVAGNISSQFITGLLFALPLLHNDSTLSITTELESKGYVDLTIKILKHFGIDIINNNYNQFIIKGNQKYNANDYHIEGDYSQAAFWLVAGILGGTIDCLDLSLNSLQGDKRIIEIIKKMGGRIETSSTSITAFQSSTCGVNINASQCPDLVPVLAVLASVSKGTTIINNAERLRIKESDRLRAITTELNKIGADIKELEDGLVIKGKSNLIGGRVDSWNDHRIAMALSVASIKCIKPLVITGSDAVRKSYPDFWQDFRCLGGKIDE